MDKIPLYTIGNGALEIGLFAQLFKQYQIQFLIDVRTSPYSKFNSEFSQAEYLAQQQLKYVFTTTGQKPDEPLTTTGQKPDEPLTTTG